MKRLLSALALLFALFLAGRAEAPPPVPTFPAGVAPASGLAPLNTRFWAFGMDAPPLDQIGVQLTVGGLPVDSSVTALGCCAIVATRASTSTGAARLVVSAPRGEISADFTIDSVADDTAPTLTMTGVIDGSGSALIIGVDGEDNVGLAGFLGRAGGDVAGAAPPGFVLIASPGADRCIQVTAVDLAGNESAPTAVCGVALDGGVGADAGAPPKPKDETGCGCSQIQ